MGDKVDGMIGGDIKRYKGIYGEICGNVAGGKSFIKFQV